MPKSKQKQTGPPNTQPVDGDRPAERQADHEEANIIDEGVETSVGPEHSNILEQMLHGDGSASDGNPAQPASAVGFNDSLPIPPERNAGKSLDME